MVDDRTVWLRVKRPRSESPVECFNTVPAKKVRRNGEPPGFTRFKYLGTSSSLGDSSGVTFEDLKDMGASGERKIILGRRNVAHIVDSSENAKQCEVHISEAPPRGMKRKAETAEDDPTTKSPPTKSIRIIDLSVKDQSSAISSALDNLKMDPKRNSNEAKGEDVVALKEASDDESAFLYDLYAASPDTDKYLDIESSFYNEDSDEFDKYLYTDDSDSNSESNWRNDYPDEDDSLLMNLSSDEGSSESGLSDEYKYDGLDF
ncbi:hypothetical protein Aperf_G00000111706 [Anoplocephala perfoliata]